MKEYYGNYGQANGQVPQTENTKELSEKEISNQIDQEIL